MQVKVVAFTRSPKLSVLASVKFELVGENGHSITVDDARVLKNRNGQLWLAMPCHSMPSSGSRGYDYFPAIILCTALKRAIDDAVLPAFEVWERDQKVRSQP
jgi:hypothetical protein